MGLVSFGDRRIGFWMADRTSPAEVPPGIPTTVEGSPVPDGSTLVLVGADQAGVPVWSFLMHEATGASLLLPWADRLVVGLGPAILLLDSDSRIHGRYRADDEWVAGWTTGRGLLLIGRKGVHLVGKDGVRIWATPVSAEGIHYLQSDEETVTLALMSADDWREVRLDLQTGAERTD